MRRELLRFDGAVERDPAIHSWMNERAGELGDIARQWFEQMRCCGDEVRELLHDGCPTACLGDVPFGYVNVFQSHVNVGFFQGAALPDPARLLEGTGKFMRHVKLRPGTPTNAGALERLIELAYSDMKRRVEHGEAKLYFLFLLAFPLLAFPLAAQAPFKATAQLNVPAQLGTKVYVSGSKEILEIGRHREITLESAELALSFPNHEENVVAASSEKLLILRSRLGNPEKKSNFNVGPSDAFGFRIWQAYKGTGKFQFVFHLDPETLKHARRNVKGGESVKLVSVWRIPADFRDFRLGLSTQGATMVPWYDLNASIGKLNSLFADPDGIDSKPSASVPAGKSFEMDGLQIDPRGVSRPSRVAGAAVDPTKPVYVVSLSVSNRLLLPARWGWQYFTAELVGSDGSVTKAYPDLINEATDTSWAGDLASGQATKSQLLFYPSGKIQPAALRLTNGATGRIVEIRL